MAFEDLRAWIRHLEKSNELVRIKTPVSTHLEMAEIADRAAKLKPNGPALQPIKLTGKRDTIARKTYIRAPQYPQAAFDRALAECKADASWQTFINDTTGHDVMIDQPQWLADLLLKVA